MSLTKSNNVNYSHILSKLNELELEIFEVAKSIGLPLDNELTKIVSQVITQNYPNTQVQIIVSSLRKTTKTKQFYETETPAMVGFEANKLIDLQKQLMKKLSWFLFNSIFLFYFYKF